MVIKKEGLFVFGITVLALSISLPAFIKSLSILIFALIILLIPILKSENKIKSPLKERLLFSSSNKYFFVPIILYLLYIIGLIYTENIKEGISDLEIKLPLLILPTLFLFIPKSFISKKNIKYFWDTYTIGVIIISLFLLVKAIIINQYPEEGLYYNISYIRLTSFFHPSYLSLFVLIAMIYIFKSDKKPYNIILFFYLALYIILLSSRSGLLGLIVVFLWSLFHSLIIEKRIRKTIFLLFSYLLIMFIQTQSNALNQRISNIETKTNSSSISPNGSFNQRKFIYLNIHKLILKSPIIGYGTGDVKEELDSFYQENNTYFEKYLNAHNQYFQTLLSIGIIGLIPLLLMLIIPTYLSIKNNKPHIIAIIALIALSLMFESMLERQMGVQGIIIIYLILILDIYIIDKKRT